MKRTVEQRLSALESRNARVEDDKAWETSIIRRLAVAALTYLTVVAYLHFVIHINPWLNAFVPVVGYVLSTLTIGLLKQFWQAKRS